MLRSLAEPEGYRLEALDGDIGRCHDFLFDDQQWTLRYMVADTGSWLPGRKVLVSPIQLEQPDWERKRLPVDLTQSQIEHSPPLDSDAPVSRRYEQAFNEVHSLPSYWLGSGLWGDFPLPGSLTAPQQVPLEPARSMPDAATPAGDLEVEDDTPLRSVREVSGYSVAGSSAPEAGATGVEKVGRVVDFIVNDTSWALRAIVVDTSRLPFSKKVLLPVDAVAEIDWASRQVIADAPADQVEDAPPFDPSEPVNERLERVLYDVYGRPHGPS